MSGVRPENEKDKRLLVLFAFGLLLLFLDVLPCIRSSSGTANGTSQLFADDGSPGVADMYLFDNSLVSSPRFAFFLNRPMPINLATKEDLALLPGIGEQLAARIIGFRNKHGRINDISELEQVPGIGRKLRRRINGFVTFVEP